MEAWPLPVEIITYILNFLPISDRKEASLVSRIWHLAAQDSMRQENICYNIPATSTSLKVIKSLARRNVFNVKMTNLDGTSTSRDVIWCVASYLGPHLHTLSLCGSSLTETCFEGLLRACPCLTALDLSGCNSLFMAGTLLSKEENFLQAQKALVQLQELNLSDIRYLSDLTFNRLTGHSPSLAKLALARCHITFEFDSYHGSNNYNSAVVLSFRNLLRFLKERAGRVKALDLSGTSISSQSMKSLVQVENLHLQELVLQFCRDLSNEAVSILCRHQPHLTTLDLSGCSELSNQAVLAVTSRLPALRCLRLGKLPRLTDGAFQESRQLKQIQNLDVSECSLVSCSELAKAFSAMEEQPKLVTLNFAFCSLLRDSTVLSLAGILSRSLRVLDLSSCVALTNRSLQAITAQLLYLTVLRLAWCKELTDWGLLGVEEPRDEHDHTREDLGQNARILDLNHQHAQKKQHASLDALTRLQELDLTACGKLTDVSIAKVIHFPELRRLSLSLVPNITDASLRAVARNCQSLEHLSLSHCVNLTDKGFVEAANSLPRLQHLVLSGCNQLTPQTLKAIGRECQQLKCLDVSMCSGITMMDVEYFKSCLPLQTSIVSRFVGGADLSLTL